MIGRRTELLLDDLEDLLLIEFFGETLDSSQSLTTIAFYCVKEVNMLISTQGVKCGAVLRVCSTRHIRELTHAGYGYVCSSATAWSLLYLHPLRRRGL